MSAPVSPLTTPANVRIQASIDPGISIWSSSSQTKREPSDSCDPGFTPDHIGGLMRGSAVQR
jgi:hypothetical protein